MEDSENRIAQQEEPNEVNPQPVQPQEFRGSEKREIKKTKITFIITGAIILFAISLWQVIGSINFNKSIKEYVEQCKEIESKIGIVTNSDSFTLAQVLQELQQQKKQNEDLFQKVTTLVNQNKAIF